MKRFSTSLFFIGMSLISIIWLSEIFYRWCNNPIETHGYIIRCINEVIYIESKNGLTVAYSPTGKILTCEEKK